jgi:SAM-dependent methyltransferase
VDRLVQNKPFDRAMEIAVGGDDAFGDVELALLDRFGLTEESYVIDAGCGSGRLTRRLAAFGNVRYLGTDVNRQLLQYAAVTAKRPEFRFLLVNSTRIPEKDRQADFVVFFSVGTHMLHEEFFLYLEDARRVLKPGGRIVFSFLDILVPGTQRVFKDTVNAVRQNGRLDHLNVFIGREDISVWAIMLGMKLVEIIPGDAPVVSTSERIAAVIGRPLRGASTGQSIAVFERIVV